MIIKLAFRNIFRNKRRTLLTMGMMVFGFVLFLVSAHFERQAEIKLFKLKQLEEAFNKAKKNERL